MRRLKLMLVGVFVVSLLLLVQWSPARASERISDTIYSFTLPTANTAVSPRGGMMASPGDWISVMGSGTFDTTARTIKASGSFMHYHSNGVMVCQGTWEATAFTGFTNFGMNSKGQEGGVLSFVVTHHCKTSKMTMTGIAMTVTSTVNAPLGSNYIEGTTVGPFTVPTGGTVVILPQQQ
jgi:hypothetical protein